MPGKDFRFVTLEGFLLRLSGLDGSRSRVEQNRTIPFWNAYDQTDAEMGYYNMYNSLLHRPDVNFASTAPFPISPNFYYNRYV